MNLHQWAIKWGVPLAAVQDLQREFGTISTDPVSHGGAEMSEGAVQTQVRLEASQKGARLWRNNVGATYDEKGNFIRYGLCNDSAQLNKKIKSGDLIGIKPVVITPAHVGATIGQFVSREIKAPGWHYSGTPREEAQRTWAEIVVSLGGDACFTDRVGTI